MYQRAYVSIGKAQPLFCDKLWRFFWKKFDLWKNGTVSDVSLPRWRKKRVAPISILTTRAHVSDFAVSIWRNTTFGCCLRKVLTNLISVAHSAWDIIFWFALRADRLFPRPSLPCQLFLHACVVTNRVSRFSFHSLSVLRHIGTSNQVNEGGWNLGKVWNSYNTQL